MKRLSLILVLTIVWLSSQAQYKYAVTLSPFSAADPVLPMLQGGFLYTVSQKWSLFHELGVKYMRSGFEYFKDSATSRSGGFRVRAEVRYYIQHHYGGGWKYTGRSAWDNNSYIAFNFFYLNERHSNSVSYYYRGNSADLRYDVFNVHRRIGSLNLIGGREFILTRRLGVDAYLGGGVRFRKYQTRNLEADADLDKLLSPRHPNVPYELAKTAVKGGKSIAGNLSLGFRIFYRF